MQHKKFNQAI